MAEQKYRKLSAFHCCLCPEPEKLSIESLVESKLLRCQKCKLISYCGLDHQKTHWPEHKEFCKTIATIRSEMKLKHILDITGNVTQLRSPQLREVKFMIQTLVVMKLHRDLTEFERELIWFPRICNFCNSHEGTLIPCPDCFAVGYCCEEHRLQDVDTHLKVCPDLHLCSILDKLPGDDMKQIPDKLKNNNFPKDLFEMHRLSTAFLNEDRTYGLLNLAHRPSAWEYQKFTNVCNFSNVATILHVLNLIQDYKPIVTSILTIHIGASTEIALFTRYECWLLFFWLPTIFYINIIVIGPELPTENGFTEISYESNRKKTVKVTYKKMRYEEFVKTHDEKMISPDLIVILNCGFADFENRPNNPWTEDIAEMLKFTHIPIVFTSCTKTAAVADMRVVRQVAAGVKSYNFKIVCVGELNPFRDHRPLRNFIGYKTDVIYYCNGYLSVILTN